MSRIDYSRTTIKINELDKRLTDLEKNFESAIGKIMQRILSLEKNGEEE